ncbi:hypothetical protein PSKAS_24880 [Peribacillus sp. N1]
MFSFAKYAYAALEQIMDRLSYSDGQITLWLPHVFSAYHYWKAYLIHISNFLSSFLPFFAAQ